MSDSTAVIVIAFVAIIGVIFVGGTLELSQGGLKINTEGFMKNWRRAQKEKQSQDMQGDDGRREVSRAQRLIRSRHTKHLPLASILWVDDHPLNNVYERRAFANLGIFCDSFETNADALEASELLEYDVVISDYGRGDSKETGGDLLRSLRATKPGTPFVFYTTGITDRIRQQAELEGASAIVDTPSELVANVLEYLKP